MPKGFEKWNVLAHGPIEKLDENLWRVEGNLPGDVPFKRVLTVVKLKDGRLVIHNAVALGDAEMKELEAWGKPAILIVPGGNHRLDARTFKERYPELRVIAPPGARAKVEQVVKVDATEIDFGDESVRYPIVEGTGGGEGYLEVKSPRGTTLVFNDAIMNVRRLAGFKGFIFNTLGFTGAQPRVAFLTKKLLIKDRAAFRAHLEKIADTPSLTRVIVSHGDPIVDSPGAAIKAAVAAL
ncbi:MAG TPA: hypothetical protein VFF06_34730 [Polyangia bacterium]|nr:hypothetical protein [Polyangia bacterium]